MNVPLHPDDFIYVDSWEKLCANRDGVAYTATEHAADLFAELRKPGPPVTVVTAGSDYGPCVQADHHPNADLGKTAIATDWSKAQAVRDNYLMVPIGPACKAEQCNNLDRYSLKVERYTLATFNAIPDRVRNWYTTNLNFEDPRATLLPFGLNPEGPGASHIPKFMGREKRQLLYVNFRVNSLERFQLRELYRHQPWVTFREDNIPVEQYLEEIADHQFVLAPPGNGLDCYRVWESVYLGSVPVLSASHFAMALSATNLPVAVVNSLFTVTEDFLYEVSRLFAQTPFEYDAASLAHWRGRILGEV